MKKIFSLVVALVATLSINAQQIAVVDEGGGTTLFRTLQAAIEGAKGGSVVYLPGGGFPISDDVKITKKLTIIGIGYKVKGENADGYTTIQGNLFFNEGSSGSALMGCKVTGTVNIGADKSEVNDVLVKYCYTSTIHVHEKCLGTIINQNYCSSKFYGTSGEVTNNIIGTVSNMDNGVIANNIITGTYQCQECDNCSITDNIILQNGLYYGSDNQFSGNMVISIGFGKDEEKIKLESFDNVFKNNQGFSLVSDFHFTEKYAEYEGKVGIYAGGGFEEKALPPVPYIVFHDIADKTDAAGKLKINVRVKASE